LSSRLESCRVPGEIIIDRERRPGGAVQDRAGQAQVME
jgi:hypothetical protein